MLTLLTFASCFFTTNIVAQQTPAKYIIRLQQSETSAQFTRVFQEMITTFKMGGLIPFEDKEVMHIVKIAREKSYDEVVLPGVYGWAGTMFGNGRMDQALTFFMESKTRNLHKP